MNTPSKIPERLIGVAVALVFGLVAWTGSHDFTMPVERVLFDLRAKLAAADERNPDIELVTVTEDDVSELGPLPWPRDVIARGVENLALAGAKVIAVNELFSEAEENQGFKAVRELKESYEAKGLTQTEAGRSFYQELNERMSRLNHDQILYEAIENAGNVVLPVYFDAQIKGRDTQVPEFLQTHELNQVRALEKNPPPVNVPVRFHKVRPLFPPFGEAAAAIGHVNRFADSDGTLRRAAHVVRYLRDTYVPSFSLAIVKQYYGLDEKDVKVVMGRGIRLNLKGSKPIEIPVMEPHMQTLIHWHAGPSGSFHRTPFTKVYRSELETSLFRDKVVVIGTAVTGREDLLPTPISEGLPEAEVIANEVANILSRSFLYRPHWTLLVEFGALILFSLFLIFGLPGMRWRAGMVATTFLVAVWAAVGTALYVQWNVWLRVAPAGMLATAGCAVIMLKRLAAAGKVEDRVDKEAVETDKMLGLSFQEQGNLDKAFKKFRGLPLEHRETKELLYGLGRAFEDQGRYGRALEAYQLIISDGRNFADCDQRIPNLRGTGVPPPDGSGTVPGEMTLVAPEFRRNLGRYELIDELGRGAMGVVYKGEDPRIHRTVAVKTINLAQFDEDALVKVKERFFREAESAGLLNHPNIVTIYDCGEEQDLAYIAMEYLEGEDLEPYTIPENLLPLRESLRIAAEVASALGYAHKKNVVHRDIKPANIMRLRGTRQVKVTDFGIARIISSSQTKTGVVLGTPSYMSPEQVSGKKVDGRSDIFSLGVVLFELVTGRKPFVGEDITSLMFKIAREPHPSPKAINRRIPPVVIKIIDKALEKDLGNRYQTAEQVASHLRQVTEKMDAIIAGKKAKGS